MKISKIESWKDVIEGVRNNTLKILVLSNYGIKFFNKIDKEVLKNTERSFIGNN